MSSPSVSIVVPVYNGVTYLGATLDSLLAQSFGDFELLVIDDGSTDASSNVVYSKKDDRIRLIRTEMVGSAMRSTGGSARLKLLTLRAMIRMTLVFHIVCNDRCR
jgi:glycosyltransferase involved in cell wall biosynthesis